MIKRLKDVEEKLEVLRTTKTQRGELTGFAGLDKLYSIKDGSYTFVLGSPTHGKSEFIFELLVNQIKTHKRSLIYSPETGSVEEIIAELVHKITGKSAYKTQPFHCDDSEYYRALSTIDWHFLIVDSEEKAYSIKELFQMVDDYERLNEGEIINYIMAEPYNEIRHDMQEFGARQDLYIEEFVGDVRRYCKKRNKHCFISLHPTGQQLVIKAGEPSYYPKPLPREAAGGQALFRKAMCWITVWRPPFGLFNPMGMPYEENEVIVSIDKAKPKGVAEKGSCSLFFNWQKNRYYEKHEQYNKYAFQHSDTPESIVSALQPSLSFNNVESPF